MHPKVVIPANPVPDTGSGMTLCMFNSRRNKGHPGIDAITMPYFGMDRGSQLGIPAVNTGRSIIMFWGKDVLWGEGWQNHGSIQKCIPA